MFCPNCGNKLEDGAKFCAYCGEKLEEAENIPAIPVDEATPEELNTPPVTWGAPEEAKAEPDTADTPAPVYPEPNAKEKKKGGKGKIAIIVVAVLLVIAAAVAAVLLLGGKKGETPAPVEEVKITNDCLLYSKDGRLYLTYAENNQHILLSMDFAHDGAEAFARNTVLPEATYYNNETGYLYFPDKIVKRNYDVEYRVSRIKLDSENIEGATAESVIDDWIAYGGSYKVSPDDSMVIYKNSDDNLYYKNLGTDEAAQRIEKNVATVVVDYGKNLCYYNDDSEVFYLNLETMESKTIYTLRNGNYIYLEYAGDSVMVRDSGSNYLVDKDGNKTYLSEGGYMQNVGDKYYYIDYSDSQDMEKINASYFVTDDMRKTDTDASVAEEFDAARNLRNRIRSIVSWAGLYVYTTDDIYLVEGNTTRLVIADVTSNSQMGTEATACYKYGDLSGVITISEIYNYIVEHYPNALNSGTVEDYYVTSAISSAFDKHIEYYIIIDGVANEIKADNLNYITTDLWYAEDYVYFCMSTGTYLDDNGYEMSNDVKIYKAEIKNDNTLGRYELVCEGGITYLDGENLFSHGELELDDDDDNYEWYWYSFYGDLYRNGTLIDEDVYICYAESMGDDFNKYRGDEVIYVKDLEMTEDSYVADVYYYNGVKSVKLGSEAEDYEFSKGGAAYCLEDGNLIRYTEEGRGIVDSDVDFLFAVGMPDGVFVGW